MIKDAVFKTHHSFQAFHLLKEYGLKGVGEFLHKGESKVLIRKLSIQNVRSFLSCQVIELDGKISIIVGPNGGGKTNLLDIIVMMLRRFLIVAPYLQEHTQVDGSSYFNMQQNQNLNNLLFEKHSQSTSELQLVEITVEVTEPDLLNMEKIKKEASVVEEHQPKKIMGSTLGKDLRLGCKQIYKRSAINIHLAKWKIESLPRYNASAFY